MKPSNYFLTREIFLKFLGVIYLIAFLSFGSQAMGLVGSTGILPAGDFLQAVSHRFGTERYWLFPTLCWLNSSDGFIRFLSEGGALLSVLLIVGFAPALVLFLLWAFYLSLVTIGGTFMSFQWDNLLLEAGFLAIFLAPIGILPKTSFQSPPSQTVLWLFRWLLFRLMFSSGVVKLASQDPSWRSLTALEFHYETQPLPTWIGWYAHQLPVWFQKFSCLVMFGIELIIPFFVFAPRKIRFFAASWLIGFQLLISLTGNYCFFNLLALALCLLLLDDTVWPNGIQKMFTFLKARSQQEAGRRWPTVVVAPVLAVILLVTIVDMSRVLRLRVKWPAPVVFLYQAVDPFRTVNSYGLFAVMTTSRPEIIVEGSNDGQTWLAYEFKWKPGDLRRGPAFVEPHQPRLDWQMWFAALGSYQHNPWFRSFLSRLLEGSPEVLGLLDKNPFPEKPPRYLRSVLYHYHFTTPAIRKATGNWWRRVEGGIYSPIVSLRDSGIEV